MTLIKDYTHIDVCRNALEDNNTFTYFKSIPEFIKILEHTSEYYGNEYIKLIFSEHGDLANKLDWKKLTENDLIGNPIIINFLQLKDYIKIGDCYYSPSTIYYIYRGLDIISRILNNDVDNNVLEIGGGYGGQCKLIIDIAKMLNIEIKNYGIIDLEYPSKLQNKYLNYFKYDNIQFFEFEHITDLSVFEKYNKLISIYALSEFEIDIQEYYIRNILKNSTNYYILCNVYMKNNFFKTNKLIDALPNIGRYHKILLK